MSRAGATETDKSKKILWKDVEKAVELAEAYQAYNAVVPDCKKLEVQLETFLLAPKAKARAPDNQDNMDEDVVVPPRQQVVPPPPPSQTQQSSAFNTAGRYHHNDNDDYEDENHHKKNSSKKNKDKKKKHSAMHEDFCQCQDPIPIQADSFCQCEDPIPISTAGGMQNDSAYARIGGNKHMTRTRRGSRYSPGSHHRHLQRQGSHRHYPLRQVPHRHYSLRQGPRYGGLRRTHDEFDEECDGSRLFESQEFSDYYL